MSTSITTNPYLFFDKNCREAMTFYQSVFGGDLQQQTYGEVDQSCPEAKKDNIMHACLSGGDILLMASDDPGSHQAGTEKTHVALALAGADEGRLREIFEALSAEGKVGIPLAQQLWGDVYGDLVDRYGIQWMVNIKATAAE